MRDWTGLGCDMMMFFSWEMKEEDREGGRMEVCGLDWIGLGGDMGRRG